MEPIAAKHIEMTPGVRSGKPRIAGTRICVSDIVIWTEQGQSPDEIVTEFPHLTLADVYAALAYYHDHREEIDRQLSQSEQLANAMKAKQSATPPEEPKDADGDGDSVPS